MRQRIYWPRTDVRNRFFFWFNSIPFSFIDFIHHLFVQLLKTKFEDVINKSNKEKSNNQKPFYYCNFNALLKILKNLIS